MKHAHGQHLWLMGLWTASQSRRMPVMRCLLLDKQLSAAVALPAREACVTTACCRANIPLLRLWEMIAVQVHASAHAASLAVCVETHQIIP